MSKRLTLSLIGVVAIIVAVWWLNLDTRTPAELVAAARRQQTRGEDAAAEKLAAKALEAEPANLDAMVIAAECATKRDDLKSAIDYYEQLTLEPANDEEFDALIHKAKMLNIVGRFSDSENAFDALLKARPKDTIANRGRASLLNAEGRRWEAGENYLRIIAAQQFAPDDLMFLATMDNPLDNRELVKLATDAVPDDPLPLLGEVPLDLAENRETEAIEKLRKIIAARPYCLEAHAQLGLALLVHSESEVPDWNARLPAQAEIHPGIWLVRSKWCRQNGQYPAAARCAWEAVKREPNLRINNYQLGQSLNAIGRGRDAKPFLERAEKLVSVNTHVQMLREGDSTAQRLRDLSNLLLKLGRGWEAWAWRLSLGESQSQDDRTFVRKCEATIRLGGTARTVAKLNPVTNIDLSKLPMPNWDIRKNNSLNSEQSEVAFANIATQAGLNFQYSNGMPAAGLQIYHTTGGGVAAIDFDLDLWPDLAFTQGCANPRKVEPTDRTDTIWRNEHGQAVDVTTEAGFANRGFGGGIGAGDINADGFPDMMIGQLGRNRLLRNNGDGTFSDLSDTFAKSPKLWTTSCLIADLNGDTLPDLYEVNYLSGDDIFTEMCGSVPLRSCGPSAFESAQDQVFLNDGSGGFTNVTARTGVDGLRGKGLGVLAADFDGDGRLSVFVANDAVENHLLVQTSSEPFNLQETGLASGIAFSEAGTPEGSMGVAVDDFDSDGDLDLYVSNFYLESNTLYRQNDPLMFFDETLASRLHKPTVDLLGFGTQSLDANLDSLPDIVVVNGDVDDFTHLNRPFRMRPQFFQNSAGRFSEHQPGAFFAKEQRGRGVARLDWNRDLRDDFSVSHLATPAALVTNQTPQPGQSIAIRLVGTKSCRDAIGTNVTVTCGERKIARQLTAGDGYQASNERQLIIGLGTNASAGNVTISWPSGQRQNLGVVSGGHQVVAIEGNGTTGLRLPK